MTVLVELFKTDLFSNDKSPLDDENTIQPIHCRWYRLIGDMEVTKKLTFWMINPCWSVLARSAFICRITF